MICNDAPNPDWTEPSVWDARVHLRGSGFAVHPMDQVPRTLNVTLHRLREEHQTRYPAQERDADVVQAAAAFVARLEDHGVTVYAWRHIPPSRTSVAVTHNADRLALPRVVACLKPCDLRRFSDTLHPVGVWGLQVPRV